MAESLRHLQHCWADHLRDPSRAAPAGIDARRLAVYRRLCIDNLDGLLAASLPRLQHRLGAQQWRATVEHYYARHACQTPLFPQVAAEFAHWLGTQQGHPLPPWAGELAHWESTQQALRIEADETATALLQPPTAGSRLLLSTQVRVLGYRWPVHHDEHWPAQPPATPTLLLMRRRPDFELQLEALPMLSYELLQAFATDGCSVAEALDALAAVHGLARDELQAACMPVLAALCASAVLLAAPPSPR